MNKLLKGKSIRGTYLTVVGIMLLILLIAGIAVSFYSWSTLTDLNDQREELKYKNQVVSETSDQFNEILFRARGYYAFLDPAEEEILLENLESFPDQLERFSEVTETEHEANLANDLADFFDQYESSLWPTAKAFVDDDDMAGLRALSSGGTNEVVNEFLNFSREFSNESASELEALNNNILSQSIQNQVILVSVFAVVLLLFLIIGNRGLRYIINPLVDLRNQVAGLSAGEVVSTHYAARKDEIGGLASAFEKMSEQIYKSEVEMLSQNEELRAQQDSLEEYLELTKETNKKITNLNKLNQILSLSEKRNEHAWAGFRYLNERFRFDKSVFSILNTDILHATGLQKDQADQIDERMQVVLNTLGMDAYRMIERPASAYELGLMEDSVSAFELTIPVRNMQRETVGYFTAVRAGTPFHQEELEEMTGIIKRIEVALEMAYSAEMIKEAKEVNQAIIENINEGIQLIGPDGSLLQYNKFSCILAGCQKGQAGYSSTESERFNWLPFFTTHLKDPESFTAFIEQSATQLEEDNKKYTFEVAHEGSERVMTVYATKVWRDDQFTGTIFVYRDITKEAEVNRMKSDLVSTVNHELRTPLSSIMGFTERMLHAELSPEKQRKYLQVIFSESERLSEMVNHFLDLQEIENQSQKYHMEERDIRSILENSIAAFSFGKRHSLRLLIDTHSSIIEADHRAIQQVIVNLLSNAKKFSPDGGQITVRLSESTDREWLYLSVKDEGIGISTSNQEKLFKKFGRITNGKTQHIKGTGLGLALSKEIMNIHNGDILVDSQAGSGSTFTLRVPNRKPDRQFPSKKRVMLCLYSLSELPGMTGQLLELDHQLLMTDHDASPEDFLEVMEDLEVIFVQKRDNELNDCITKLTELASSMGVRVFLVGETEDCDVAQPITKTDYMELMR